MWVWENGFGQFVEVFDCRGVSHVACHVADSVKNLTEVNCRVKWNKSKTLSIKLGKI